MRPLRGVLWVCALGVLVAEAGSARAAWNNVFQVCCHKNGCRSSSSLYYGGYSSYYGGYSSYYGAPSACCPQPACCTTQYVQRCYYQPVTSYYTRTYYEPVTSYRTSYYYEPVTTYRYSCYYDPCTCSYQQVACPTTCYRLRSQCCPVTSYVQRCAMVPVTTYRQSCYYEPVTSCYQPTCCAPCSQTAPVVTAPAVAAPAVSESSTYQAPATPYQPPASSAAPPAVSEQRSTPAPPMNGDQKPMDRIAPYSPQNNGTQPPASGSSLRGLPPLSAPARPVQPAPPPPAVRLDRIVSLPSEPAQVQGQVVNGTNAPRANAQLMFRSAEPSGTEQAVVADATGKFRVTLASGGWLMYVAGNDGQSVFHGKIDVRGNETRQVTLVSR